MFSFVCLFIILFFIHSLEIIIIIKIFYIFEAEWSSTHYIHINTLTRERISVYMLELVVCHSKILLSFTSCDRHTFSVLFIFFFDIFFVVRHLFLVGIKLSNRFHCMFRISCMRFVVFVSRFSLFFFLLVLIIVNFIAQSLIIRTDRQISTFYTENRFSSGNTNKRKKKNFFLSMFLFRVSQAPYKRSNKLIDSNNNTVSS